MSCLSIDLSNALNDASIDNFTCLLFRLMLKADQGMLDKLAKGFPVEAECVRIYRDDCPYMPVNEVHPFKLPDFATIERMAREQFEMPVIKWNDWTCRLVVGRYAQGGTAIELVSAVDMPEHELVEGSPIARITVHLTGYQYTPYTVHIKDYSENEGLLDMLQRYNIVGPVIDRTHSGFVSIPVVSIIHPAVRRAVRRVHGVD